MFDIKCEMKYALGHYVQEWCERSGEADLLVTMGAGRKLQHISYQQVQADYLAWAREFAKQGIKAGDRIAMIAAKSVSHFSFFYACWHLGAIAVPICETLGDLEMGFILRDCGASLIVADKTSLTKVKANAGDITVLPLDGMPAKATLDKTTPQLAEMAVDDVAVLIYTSGSTGMPKGVMLTHKNLWVNAFWALQFFKVSPGDGLMSLLPYWHSYALVCEILCVAMGGASALVPRGILDFKKNLAVYSPTIMIAVPRVVEVIKAGIDKTIAELPEKKKTLIKKAIYNASRIFTAGPKLDGGILRMFTHYCFYDPLVFKQFRKAFGSKLRFIVCGGAPMDLELQIFFKYMGIMTLVGYGLTETSPVISANIPSMHKLGSCGKPLPWLLPENGGDFTFKDEDGSLGKDKHGQLLVKGDCVMKGYWHHTDASAKTFEDGWLNTGDVGHCDEDGYLYIHGRKGSMIVLFGGEKLHPEHIEDAVKKSTFISEAMVIGEKCKNVYVCVNVPEEQTKDMTAEEIKAKAKAEVQQNTAHLAPYQKPKDVLVLPTFNAEDGTMTATLKIRRFKIKELYKAEIEAFLVSNGEEIAIKHSLGIASSKIQASMEHDDASK